ncbi:DNA polymerase III subunit psi [Salinivibrio sp. ES.052]|uniref:DNA polymerase III subunit psi n=1 Tax=Salinivibrio sp. ES.052 TaxID=1882823 RepID=UPI00092B27DE|nr:DNA polymerase III subunit psi [Salinivibrio sp. ES.052]SIN72875.1 DNA polymerase III, psi subunit [Salinivibrio sp. ES.052]
MLTDIQRLQAMGLEVWQLRHPELYGKEHEVIQLPDSCQLLLVCDFPLNEQDAWLFGNILKSIQLTSDQARQLPHAALSSLGEHHLTWCWYIDAPDVIVDGVQSLHSIPLAQMHDNPAAKRDLWHQICQYE